MIIALKKFGTVLMSRQAGKEAYNAFTPSLNEVDEYEPVIIDFDGVSTFTPSWGDEFLTPIFQKFGTRLMLMPTGNASVQMTLETLESVHHITFPIQQ